MALIHVVLRFAFRNRVRALATAFGVGVALLGFLLLRTVVASWYSVDSAAARTDRLIVRHKISIMFPLSAVQAEKIRALPGVELVSWFCWTGGVYVDEKQIFDRRAVDAESYFAIYPEYKFAPEQMKAWLADPAGAAVGDALAKRYGWKLGDHVAIKGTYYPGNWDFTVRAIYDGGDLTLAATFAGIAATIFVLTTMLMMAFGIQQTMVAAGQPSNAKAMLQNAPAEVVSYLSSEQVRALTALPEVALVNGEPMVSPELVTLAWVPHTRSHDPDDGANIAVRGLLPAGLQLRRIRHLEGRLFTPGLNEVVIGAALAGKLEGAYVGGTMKFGSYEWKVVGVAEHGGSAHDSEIWGDLLYLQNTLKRPCASVTVGLKDPGLFEAFVRDARATPTLNSVAFYRESEYWRSLSKRHVRFITLFGLVIAGIFSFGVISSAVNTMYGQVASRMREFGTLRAIGYRPRAVLVSLVFESVALAFFAGVVGVGLAAMMTRVQFQSSVVEALTEITCSFFLNQQIVLTALTFACVIGYVGSLLPGLKAARMRLVDALRGE